MLLCTAIFWWNSKIAFSEREREIVYCNLLVSNKRVVLMALHTRALATLSLPLNLYIICHAGWLST